MITYQQEFLSLTDKAEILPLLREDWDEIDHPIKSGADLDPEWQAYEDLEARGMFKVFTAREDGELIGYFGVFIAPVLHARGRVQPMMDAIYVRRDKRASRVAVRLIRFVERCLREDGMPSLCVVSTAAFPLVKLFQRLGYVPAETRLVKEL